MSQSGGRRTMKAREGDQIDLIAITPQLSYQRAAANHRRVLTKFNSTESNTKARSFLNPFPPPFFDCSEQLRYCVDGNGRFFLHSSKPNSLTKKKGPIRTGNKAMKMFILLSDEFKLTKTDRPQQPCALSLTIDLPNYHGSTNLKTLRGGEQIIPNSNPMMFCFFHPSQQVHLGLRHNIAYALHRPTN